MKTGSQTITFCVTFLQLLLSNISLFAVLFTDASIFFACFLVKELCRSGCRQSFSQPPPPTHPHVFAPTHNPLFSASDSYLKLVRA